jgi:hypothetical protein
VPKTIPFVCRSVAVLATLAFLASFAGSDEKVLADERSTPVVSVDNPGRIPYQAFATAAHENLTPCSTVSFLSTCLFLFPAVSKGHRLVIEHVSGNFIYGPNQIPDAQVSLFNTENTSGSYFLVKSASDRNNILFDQPVLFYSDAGEAPTVKAVLFNATLATSPVSSVTLTGYLLDCRTSPCAPIAP